MSLNIVPECYADTRLAEILTQSKRCNHQKNLGMVARTLQHKMKDIPAFGIVDDDKQGIPKYFLDFDLVVEQENLKLLKHKNRQHYLAVICPAIEHWLLIAASLVQVNPDEFGLKDNVKEFSGFTKSIHLRQNQKFTDFVKALVKEESAPILLLKKWLQTFNERGIVSP